MNPQSQENTPSFELPNPGQGEKNLPQDAEQFRAPATETQGAVAVEKGISAGQASQAAAAQTGVPIAPPPVPAAGAPQTQAANPTGWMPPAAEDTDLIEREWVDKAKEIVAQTSHDPYLQNKEMNRVRADYMKKRYNKDIKLNEE
jgi:hypothetical protein